MDNAPTPLYHYTSAEGLLGIVQSGAIWATQVQYMNDEKEWHHAMDIAKTIVQRFACQKTGARSEVARDLLQHLGGSTMSRTFAFSLTAESDLLSQWRGYCPHGGYSIGFDANRLAGAANAVGFRLRRCIYDDKEKEVTIEKVLAEVLMNLPEICTDFDVHGLANTFVMRVRSSAEFFKHASFKEEKEWRLVGPVSCDDARSRWRTRNGLIVPYVQLDLGAVDFITEIVTGPKLNSALAGHSIDFLFRALGREVRLRKANSTLI